MQGTISYQMDTTIMQKGGYIANNLNTVCFLEVQTKCQGHNISRLLTWVLFLFSLITF